MASSFRHLQCLALLLSLVILPAKVWAQVPAWQTLTVLGQAAGDDSGVNATATDAAGNVYIAGSFTGTASFGSISLTSTGRTDGFVAKWNQAAGRFEWAQQVGGANNERIAALAVSGSAVFLAGSTNSPAASFGTLSVAADISGDAFLARLNDAGTSSSFAWATKFGGNGTDAVTAMTVSGNFIYLTGTYTSASMPLGNDILTNTSNAGYNDGFVTKMLDFLGNGPGVLWTQRITGTQEEIPTALALSASNLYVSGYSSSPSVGFGSISLTNASSTTSDLFVTKLVDASSSSTFSWAQRAGGSLYEQATSLAVNGNSVYVTGRFNSTALSLGSITLTNATTAGTFDAFVAKLTDFGTSSSFTWALRAGSTGNDFPWALAAVGNQLYVAGSFTGGPLSSFGTSVLTNNDPSGSTPDVFVAKVLDAGSSGSFAWGQSAGGSGSDYGYSLAISGSRIWVAGVAVPAVAFGSLSAAAPSGVSTGFLAAINDQSLPMRAPVWAPQFAFFPNPARNSLSVQLPATKGGRPAQLVLTDVVGRRLHTMPVATAAAAATTSVQLPTLAAGLYWLELELDGQRVKRQLIIE